MEVKMSRNGFIFRLIGVLLLLGLVAAGGFMAYKTGVAQGIAQAPEVAAAIEKSAENGQVAPVPPMYGYGYGYGYPHPYGFGYPHHFNPFGAICFSFLFLFLFFGAMRMIFFRRMGHGWGHHGHHGPWGKWEGGFPPMFDEWHKRAHGEKPAEEEK
jgi:hypothetical protein